MPQSLSAVYIHLVFSTKDRRPLLRDKPTRDALHSYLGGVSKQLDCPPILVGGVEDHVHLLARFGRTITQAEPAGPGLAAVSGSAGEVRVNGGSLVHELTTGNPKSVPRRTPGTEKPVGEWNAYDIVCRSNTVAIHVNGILQNEITGSSVDAGAIGLQAGRKPVEFRNLVLEPLAEAAKP
jgi:hypothetical protein